MEQWKARTTGKPWSLTDITTKVLPDLYQDPALDHPGDETRYVFATEGCPTEEAQSVFERFRKSVPEDDPLAGLRQGDQKVLRDTAEAVRKRRQFRSEPDSLTYPKLRRLLSRFEIREGQKASDLTEEIRLWLLPQVDIREEAVAKREQLCSMILSKAAHGEVEIVPKDLLREAGLRGVSLANMAELRKRALEVVEREVARRRYDRDRDVRNRPDWPEDKPILIVAGESGQGKTWQLARLALEFAREKDGDKSLSVFLVSQGNAAGDLQQAADLLWKQAWGHDATKSLDRVADHLWEVQGNTGQPWLVVCVDGVQSLSEARTLIDAFDWERWGIRLALSVPREVGVALERERPDQVHLRILRNFTESELRQYLLHHNRSSEELPPDVRETLKRPLLAGIYTRLESDPQWRPTREYMLYEEYWRRLQTAREQADHPEDLIQMKRLALTLLDEEPSYPWTWEQLEQVGLTAEPRRRLEQAGWWVRTSGGEGMEVWHDRLLSWALAVAVAERGSAAELANWLRRDRRPAVPRIWQILAYLPLDVLWVLCGDPAKVRLVPDLIISKEEEYQPSGFRWLYEMDLPSLGRHVFQSVIERVRRLPDRVRYSYVSSVVECLSRILAREPDGQADLPPLLKDPSLTVREVAVGTLARHPHPEAVNLLWDRLRDSSRSIDESPGAEGHTAYQRTFAALRACLDLDPAWLRARILETDSEREPVWDLAYLLANLKNPGARRIWLEVKSELFRKMPPYKLRSLAVCIRVFHDTEEVPRLESWLSVSEDWTDLKAFRSLAWVDPDRAVQLLATLPLNNLSDHHFGSWLPILLLKRPDKTRRALRERLVASGPDFWKVADLYIWYEERMDRETAELLLDRLSSEATWNSLRRPLGLLSRIHRLGLLQVFEKLAGTELDRRLGELGVSWVNSEDRHDLRELRSILLKIGGDGFRSLIQAGLASTDPEIQREALGWGWMFPEEIASSAIQAPLAHALLGENRALSEAVGALEVENRWQLNDLHQWLTSVWRMRRGKPPMPDEELAPAFEALQSTEARKRMRGLDAVAISGRSDLLSRLPEWLAGFGELAGEELQELDQCAAYLVHHLAGEAPESVRQLSQGLDFGRFPTVLGQLYGRAGAEELPDRLEQHLLSHREPGQFGDTEMDFALTLSHSRHLDSPTLRAVWSYGKDAHEWNREVFWKAMVRLDSEEVVDELWKASQDRDAMEDERLDAIPALALLEPAAAFDVAARHLRDAGPHRNGFVWLLLDLDAERAVPVLIEQAVREQQTEVLWTIARRLRRAGPAVERELRARLESPDFRVRTAAVHLAGWAGPGFLKADLTRMAAEDPDDDVQWECLQALDRQNKESCVLELMDAFRSAHGVAQWSYLESILELGDPHLLRTKDDSLWIGKFLPEELSALNHHAAWRLEERIRKVKQAAEREDRDRKD